MWVENKYFDIVDRPGVARAVIQTTDLLTVVVRGYQNYVKPGGEERWGGGGGQICNLQFKKIQNIFEILFLKFAIVCSISK